MNLTREQLTDIIEEEKVIAIVRGVYGEEAEALAEALLRGGVHLMELTFDPEKEELTRKAADSILRLNERFGRDMCFGAGTVTKEEQVQAAVTAGARFIVSPDTNERVIRASVEAGLVSVPGALTPTEISAAHRFGADFVKVFPADSMGPAYFKAVKAPLSNVRLLAVGGVNRETIGAYLQAGASGAGVAGCLFNKQLIAEKNWAKITENAELLMKTVREKRV